MITQFRIMGISLSLMEKELLQLSIITYSFSASREAYSSA